MASDPLTTVNFLEPIQSLMTNVELLMRQQADSDDPDLSAALGQLLSSGGKRIRPAVTLLTGRMLDGDTEKLITLSAAIELLHTATLVHDDLIDGASLRRGNTTINAQWSPAATVLTGDYIFARAAKLAAATESVVLMGRFAETLATIVSGEITQLFSSPWQPSREDYDRRIYAKTASLFELATETAAMLSPVDEQVVSASSAFGYSIGMAFQIVDDILDFTGEQSTVGKPVASDLRQGLITLPALYYLEEHPEDPDFNIILEGENNNAAALERLIVSIGESGAIQGAMVDAQRYIDGAIEILKGMPPNEARRGLEDLALYIVNRRL